ncbi:beta-amylase 2 [Actinidia rufa]|uniref:Beta-amylase n=1 Tax=Actinidia rufa TaxID=165716 RepID=A0A7J0G7T9_9ERIC|nr:beta-amylase 2 [Actinidia rufa]
MLMVLWSIAGGVIVEAHAPQDYNWNGYKRLFQMVRELKLKLQVVLSFHECGGNIGDDVCIPLPQWVAEIGRSNPDIFFTDREGRRNPECLSWGIDKERVLRGRTAVEVYFDYMRSFRVEFDEFFEDGIISIIEVGLGPCGELRYPSNPVKHGWRYPGVGEFQCYDQYLLKNLRKAAEARGHSFWARGPDNAGSYNSQPHETGFFCDGGDYDGYYGRFFLNWYSKVLVDHGDRVLMLAKLAFEGTCIAVKLSGIYWWYKTASHAAELTAGFYNPCNRDGYAAIMAMLKKHGAALNFMCAECGLLDQHVDFPGALADPEGLAWQVLNAAWDVCIPVASENALPCHDREGYNNISERAKPLNDPDGGISVVLLTLDSARFYWKDTISWNLNGVVCRFHCNLICCVQVGLLRCSGKGSPLKASSIGSVADNMRGVGLLLIRTCQGHMIKRCLLRAHREGAPVILEHSFAEGTAECPVAEARPCSHVVMPHGGMPIVKSWLPGSRFGYVPWTQLQVSNAGAYLEIGPSIL